MSADPYNDKVHEFHEAFGLMVRHTPNAGSHEERALRVRLMLEEALEFANAAGVIVTCSTGGRVDNLAPLTIRASEVQQPDLTAMAHGTAVQLGIPLLPVLSEVHAANMRKLGADGKPIINARGKVRKPEGWRPADVGAVLKRLNEGEE